MHKMLAHGGIRLSVVVSDLHGQSARRMVRALVESQSPEQVIELAGRRLKTPGEEILEALDGELSEAHRFVLDELLAHIEQPEVPLKRFDQQLLAELDEDREILALLQTLPGVDRIGAAMLLVEIGNDMEAFGSPERLASWVRICPGNNESAGKRKSGKIRKGNPHARRLLCEFAHAASRARCGFQVKYKSLAGRKGNKRHHGLGSQIVAHHLLHDPASGLLPGFPPGLRGTDGRTQRPKLDPDAQSARLLALASLKPPQSARPNCLHAEGRVPIAQPRCSFTLHDRTRLGWHPNLRHSRLG